MKLSHLQNNYIGNCTQEDIVEDIFGSISEFARQVEIHGDEFTYNNIIVKYDDSSDIHSFYMKV